MDRLKKERTVARCLFSKAKNVLEEKFREMEIDDITSAFGLLQHKAEELFSVDERIKEQWLNAEDNLDEEAFMQDSLAGDNYRYDWERMKVMYDKAYQKFGRTRKPSGSDGSDISNNTVKSQQRAMSSCNSNCHSRRFRLPKIELRKFDGSLKNWIGFWGQFKKIDSDEGIDDEDKFQYLYQCTVPDSPARELIDSFPPSGANYKKAIDQLKSRFARDDLLIEVYVRELLTLVLAQAKGNTLHNLSHLYDKLNTQLQALQSLGVTMDKYAALLFPLVESALPESVLRAWERSQTVVVKTEDHLSQLMTFLKREVETEERIQLARSGLASGDNSVGALSQPTAACLVSTEDPAGKKACIWCDKTTHSSMECYKANKITYEERKQLLEKKKGCSICLKTGHNNKVCRNFSKCLICHKRHSILMCPDIKTTKQEKPVNVSTSKINNNVSQNKGSKTTLLQTVIIKIENGDKHVKIRAFIDTGSQRSYIRRDVVDELCLKSVSTESLSHCLFGGIETKQQQFKCYEFCASSLDDRFRLNMTALDKTTICGFIPRVTNNNAILSQLEKHNITLSDVGGGEDAAVPPEISLLIGADYAGLLLTESFIQLDNNLIALRTRFGWTLQGPILNACSAVANVVSVNFQLTDLWDLETLGIKDPAEIVSKTKKDSMIMEEFRRSIKVNMEGRYEVDLPWKLGHTELLDNKHLAEKRLTSTTQRLLKLNEFDNYGQVFEEWLQLGIIEIADRKSQPKHYLSHHPVIKDTSLTTRVRPVFDASARDFNGNSLNSFLEKGINCLELIPKLLIKFRKHAIGITSDIKKAFLQISLKEEDRQYLSFLWWKNNERNEIITYRHCRVVFGLSSSPFLLSATILYHLAKYTNECKDTAERLKNSFYVDNCITSLETEAETKVFIEEAKKTMFDGQFELRGWVSAPMTNSEMTGNEESLSVLGVIWNLKSDELYCNVNFINDLKDKVTKRELLSITQKIFDPIGVLCPVTLVPKLILQKTWDLKLSWDKELPDNLQKEFLAWLKYINLLNECRIPRRLTSEAIDKCHNSLHVFCDASKVSFATAIFLRSEIQGEVNVQLVQAKSRVAPVREVTIPRLELMAALIATRLYVQSREALELVNCKVFFWTDSSVALTWITIDGDWNIFVKNRVREIRQYTDKNDWRHLPGPMNPADLPSRGCNAKHLLESKWWEGPEWLKLKEVEWPKAEFCINEQEVNKEAKKKVVANITTELITFLSKLTYFSKYAKIVRMVGWITRFTHNCRNANNKVKGELSYEEFRSAEKKILKMIQQEAMIVVNKGKKNDLHLIKDDEGIIRVRTRLLLSDEPADFVCPIYLPGKHPIIERLVASKHHLLNHAGSNTLMAKLREHYWITSIRKLVKSTISKCISCKRQSVKHAEVPSAPLPRDRVKSAAAFEVTGIDLAGPLFLLSGGKVWVILFTCAIYRAIHLELTKSLTTKSFLMALRRFIARRGRVDTIYTDNGTNFHGADNLLKTLDWDEIASYSTVRNIKWKFNPPAAPWWGGWWERLIRSVKELLRRNLGNRTLSYEELETVLCDCESVVNSRPLTYIVNSTENLKPLTPACFLQGPSSNDVPDLDQIDRDSLDRRLKYLHKLRGDLRERFRNEYLGMLVQKGKERGTRLGVGDVVLIETEARRIKWPLGLIVEILPGSDSISRVAKIRTADGAVYVRPFQRLYPLEISTVQRD